MNNKNRSAVSANLKALINEGTDAVDRVGGTSKKLSREGMETIVGVFGGFAGLAIAYALSVADPNVSFAITAIIGFGLGLSGGMIAFRGTRTAKLERELDSRRRAGQYLLEEIVKLPKSAPKEVRDALYLEYQRVITNVAPATAPSELVLLPTQKPTGTLR
jgi:hypothetical protein